jgi:hypothetical protein
MPVILEAEALLTAPSLQLQVTWVYTENKNQATAGNWNFFTALSKVTAMEVSC